MAEREENSVKKPRRRRWLVLLAVLLAGGVAGWQVVKALIDIERYRPQIIAALEEASGLRVTLGGLDLKLLPTPRLAVENLSLGEGDFAVAIDSITAQANLASLRDKEIRLTTVRLRGVVVRLPEDLAELQEKAGRVAAAASAGGSGSETSEGKAADFAFRIGRIALEEVSVFWGGERIATADIEVLEPLSGRPELEARVEMPALGDAARATIKAVLDMAAEGAPGITASIALEDVSLRHALKNPDLPETALGVQIELAGALPDEIEATITGTVKTALAEALEGGVRAKAWWRDGQATVNDFQWNSPGIALAGDLSFTPPSEGRPFEIACEIPSAKATGAGLQTLAGFLPGLGVTIRVRDDGALSIRDFLIGVTEQGGVRFAQGQITLGGIDLLLPDGTTVFENLSAEIALEENTIRIARLTGANISISGTVTPDLDAGEAALDLQAQVRLEQKQLAPWLPPGLVKGLTGTIDIEELRATLKPGAALPEDLTLRVRLAGLGARLALPGLSEDLALENINGRIGYANGKVAIDALSGAGFAIEGSVRPDFASRAFAVDLQGEIDLAQAPLAAFLPPNTVSGLAGKIRFNRITGTFGRAQGVPGDLVVDAALRDGALTLAPEIFDDVLSGVRGTLSSTAQAAGPRIDFTLGAESKALGTLYYEGRFDPGSQKIEGALSLDIQQAANAFLSDAATRDLAAPVLEQLGQSTLDLTAHLPRPDAPGASLAFSRRGAPPISGQAVFAPQGEGLALDSVSVSGDLPLAWIPEDAWPLPIEASGPAHIAFDATLPRETFTLEARLDDASLAAPPLLEKKAGVPLSIVLAGSAAAGQWAPQKILVAVLGEEIELAYANEIISAEDFAVNLASLAPLLPESFAPKGTLRGSFSGTTPPALALTLEGVGFALAPEVALDAIDGTVSYRDNYWSAENLRVQGADSDFTVSAQNTDGPWQAKVTGRKLNLNVLGAVQEAADAFFGSAGEADGGSRGETTAKSLEEIPPIAGNATVALEQLYYQRGRVDDLRLEAEFSPTGITVKNFRCIPYTGMIRGTIFFAYETETAPASVDADLRFEGVDLRIVDHMLLAEAKGVSGTANGVIDLRFPLGDTRDVYRGLDGHAAFAAKDGSYGRMGMATKLLTVLRTTELLRLKLPGLKDKGLVFDATEATLRMRGGRLEIEKFTLDSKAYAMEALGVVDYPADHMDVSVRVRVLEALSSLIGAIPGLRKAVEKVKEHSGLRLRISGPPYDPKIQAFAGDSTKQPAEDGVLKEEGSLGGGLRGLGESLRKKIGL